MRPLIRGKAKVKRQKEMKVAIASGKGGTGKTMLSTNLAALIAKNDEVILTDLDVEEPNSRIFIQGEIQDKEIKYSYVPEWNESTCSSCGKCQEVCNFNAIIKLADHLIIFPRLCHGCYACSELCPTGSLPMIPQRIGILNIYKKEKITFVESLLDIGQEQAVPLIAQTKEYIDDNFNGDILKLYDSPPGTSCPVIEAIKDSDFVILVTEPTPFGLHDLQLAVETVRKLNISFGVVVNRFGIGNSDVFQYCEKNNIPILAQIPNDRRIATHYSSGHLVYDKIPEVRQELLKISEYIRKFGR